MDALERTLAERPRARLLYVIPTFQNPSGVSLPAEGRRRVVELARERGVLVVEDDPYGLLRFEGEPAPTLHELDGGDNVDLLARRSPRRWRPASAPATWCCPSGWPATLARLSENT